MIKRHNLKFLIRAAGLAMTLVGGAHAQIPDGVDVVVDVNQSAVALAAQKIGKKKNRLVLISGAASSRITNEDCNDITVAPQAQGLA
jgi:hypothetical protein